MSDNSTDSTIDEEEEWRAGDNKTNSITRRLQALFCCFRHKLHADSIVEDDPDEYVVEKLVVRRVPLALFAIPANIADDVSRSTVSSTPDGAGSITNAKREASTRLKTERTNETLRLANEHRNLVGERLDCRAKSSVWREEIPSKFNSLHLKESESLLEDPLTLSRDRRLFAEDISEVTSSTRTDVSSRTTSSMIIQDDIPTRDDCTYRETFNPLSRSESERKSYVEGDETTRDLSSRKERDKLAPGRNRKYIVSPFGVRRGSFDLMKSKGIVGDLGIDGKSLSYIEKSLEDKSSEPTGNMKDRELEFNTAVRWRINVRRQRANAILEHAVSKV